MYDIDNKKVTSPQAAHELIQMVLDLNSSAVEKFGIITLNTKHAIAGIHIISIGTLNSSIVHPRDIFTAAVLNNASGIVLFHNHPSGDPEPSREDIETTQRLISAGEIMGIKVLDHVIVGENRYCSFKERGLI